MSIGTVEDLKNVKYFNKSLYYEVDKTKWASLYDKFWNLKPLILIDNTTGHIYDDCIEYLKIVKPREEFDNSDVIRAIEDLDITLYKKAKLK